MTLLAPWALWFAVLGAAVVALYLLKIKRRRATVPALDFWRELAGKTRVHSLFERLKRLLSMLLWLAILACLVMALGNPILSLGRIKPRVIAVIIDNSASMQTSEDDKGTTRLELAKRAVEDLTSRRPVTDEWLLIEAAREPRVLQPWTFDTKAIRLAGGKVRAFGGSGDLGAAVELAGQLLSGKLDPCIVVVSDGAAGALEPLAKADSRIVYWPVGKSRDNLGITRLAVRADRQKGNYQALIAITNASDQKIDTQVMLDINSSTQSVELVSIEPGGSWEKTVVIEPPQGLATSGLGGVLRASLDRSDALALDNQAFAILQPIRPAIVWLISPADSAFFFEQALGSMEPLILPEESITMTPEKYEQIAPAIAAKTAMPGRTPDLIIFNDCAPYKLPPTGRFVLVNSWPKEIPVAVTGEIEAPQLFISPRPHPMTQHINLQGSHLAKASKVTLKEPARVLANTSDGDPLILHFEQQDRQVVSLAFDVLDSDLPFRNAFPLLLRNIVAFMHEEAPSLLKPEVRIGEAVQPLRRLPDASKVTVAVTKDGKMADTPVAVHDGTFAYSDTSKPGAVRLQVGDERSYAAVNLADAGESRIEPMPVAEDAAAKLMLSRRLLGSMPWVGLTLLALAVIALEWLTYHHRWTE